MSSHQYTLDAALALQAHGQGSYQLALDQRFWNMQSAFGGWLAAACVAVVEAESAFRFSVVTQQINFHSAVREEQLLLSVKRIEQRRTLDIWQVNVSSVERPERVMAAATIVAGERELTEIGFEPQNQSYRPSNECIRMPSSDATPNWFEHFDIRLAKGRPFAMNESANSVTYVKESDGRPLDSRALVAIADTPMPRTFFRSQSMTSAATISMATYVYASNQELQEAGNDFVLLDTRCQVIRHGFVNQETYLYRADGLLLGTSYQTARFREQ